LAGNHHELQLLVGSSGTGSGSAFRLASGRGQQQGDRQEAPAKVVTGDGHRLIG